ncbi:MAG TPA: DUF2161 family putative PD-(D/E)XK-type phosphodiesterase [Clostridia bacterium]|nr:DUF2161 family putative PD-(D/E)XK-type phosphodiesterase [Clostridia bacterium]
MSSKKKKDFHEEDMYKPIYDYLSGLGYTVRSEVSHCDIAAAKDDQLLIVEMKKSLNLDLILQATLRQKLADMVYVAVPKPGRDLFSKRWSDLCYLLKRLQLGLIYVSIKEDCSFAEVAFEPVAFDMGKTKKKNKKKQEKLIEEFEARHGDFNVGGSTGKKLVTAYKEQAIHIACCLLKNGPLSTRTLRKLGTDEKKTFDIVYQNHYGWFENISKGVYDLSADGREEIGRYPQLVEYYTKLIEDKKPE